MQANRIDMSNLSLTLNDSNTPASLKLQEIQKAQANLQELLWKNQQGKTLRQA